MSGKFQITNQGLKENRFILRFESKKEEKEGEKNKVRTRFELVLTVSKTVVITNYTNRPLMRIANLWYNNPEYNVDSNHARLSVSAVHQSIAVRGNDQNMISILMSGIGATVLELLVSISNKGSETHNSYKN
jgi:hypothetical protein